MKWTFTCTLILLSFFGTSGKYVYVQEAKTWTAAKLYCQQKHTDLAPISSKNDIKRMQQTGKANSFRWTGTKNGVCDPEKWMWWGGGRVSWMSWTQNDPTDTLEESDEHIPNYDLNNFSQIKIPFFCYNLILVKKKKTWEEALEYCRENHNMLASVTSETEMLLIHQKRSQCGITEHVWIGLHFFPVDGWLWVDSEPLVYEAWGSGGKPGCPRGNLDCAALKMNRCNNGKGPNCSKGSSGAPAGHSVGTDEENVWEAHECKEKLYFICY